MKRYLVLAICGYCLCFMSGCGGGGVTSPSVPPPPASLQITSPVPPDGALQTHYGVSLTARGGKSPYAWSWVAAQGSMLPAGLTVSTNADNSGTIAGIPTATGAFNVVIQVSDAESPAARTTVNYTITVGDPGALAITSGLPPNGTLGTPYGGTHIFQGHNFTGFPLTATGGAPGYTWHWTAAAALQSHLA